MTSLAFDVYGTLIDTAGVTGRLKEIVGERASEFSSHWRSKQLEYTWRYGLMRQYRDFRTCTRQALDWTCDALGFQIKEQDRLDLMQAYLELPPFHDVIDGLNQLRSMDVAMYAFSNGVPEDLDRLLDRAGLKPLLDGIVSFDELKNFKPDPSLYHNFAKRSGDDIKACCLVSSNGFDVCGAVSAGMRAFWLQRDPSIQFDHWEFQPTWTVSGFEHIIGILEKSV